MNLIPKLIETDDSELVKLPKCFILKFSFFFLVLIYCMSLVAMVRSSSPLSRPSANFNI